MSINIPYDDSSTPFQLLYHDSDGDEDGYWLGQYGQDSERLDHWDLHTRGTPTYYFEFTTNQSIYAVFTLMTEWDGDAEVTYYGSQCTDQATAKLSFTLTGDRLTMQPCALITSDPRIKILTANTPTTTTVRLEWDGSQWFQGGTAIDPLTPIEVTCTSLTVSVTDYSASHDSDSCGLYYPTSNGYDTYAGEVYAHDSNSTHSYSLSLTTDQVEKIPEEGGVRNLIVNLFKTLDPGNHHTLKNR